MFSVISPANLANCVLFLRGFSGELWSSPQLLCPTRDHHVFRGPKKHPGEHRRMSANEILSTKITTCGGLEIEHYCSLLPPPFDGWRIVVSIKLDGPRSPFEHQFGESGESFSRARRRENLFVFWNPSNILMDIIKTVI